MTHHKYLPTRKMLDISTTHIPEHTATALGGLYDYLYAPLFNDLAYTPWGGYGWIFYVGEDYGEYGAEHPELAAVIEFARSAGYDYLKLDCDAEKIDDLPTFEW